MEQIERRYITLIALTLLSGTVFSQSAYAQMAERPWSFAQQNRASIAALMKSIEGSNSNSSATVSQSAGSTTLVCGSDGDSSAQGTASCIILNNSTGSVMLDQDTEGSQTATSEQTTNVEETINGADDVLAVLSGE